MSVVNVLLLLLTGGGAGLAGSLVGVGGAFVMTPVQYALYLNLGMPPDAAIKTAFGTSLAVVFLTAASGALRHRKYAAVSFRTAVVMGLGGALSAAAGSLAAGNLPGSFLRIAFGAVVLLSAVRMLLRPLPEPGQEPVKSTDALLAWSVPVGIISGMTGVGGGGMWVPIMVLALRFPMHRAVGTSLAVIVFTSLGGTIGYIITGGPGLPESLPYTTGYVNWLACLLLAATSVPLAQVGATLAHRLPARYLKLGFSVILLYIGLRMLGIFDMLGLPL